MDRSLRAPPSSIFAQVPHLRAEIGRRTVRERISDKLASLIASGILQVGEELPSERELAALLAVSRETVRGAIQTLAALGEKKIIIIILLLCWSSHQTSGAWSELAE